MRAGAQIPVGLSCGARTGSARGVAPGPPTDPMAPVRRDGEIPFRHSGGAGTVTLRGTAPGSPAAPAAPGVAIVADSVWAFGQ
ncbi:hypothetical protein GCM10010388_14290 [Streptomyces mauvecolor]